MSFFTRHTLVLATIIVAATAASAAPAPAQLADAPLANTADPGVMPFRDGFVVLGTSKVSARGAFPIKYSTDLRTWRKVGQVFVGGSQGPGNPSGVPTWIDLGKSKGLWAPEIEVLGNSYAVYYAAIHRVSGKRCIGRAATTGTTNFTFVDRGSPLLCNPRGSYSLIDPSLFHAPTGQTYLLYSRGLAGEKEIVITQINADGQTGIGIPRSLIAPTQAWETRTVGGGAGTVEAPTMIFKNGWYFLFYSGNDFRTDKYGVGVARSRSPVGPFEKNPANPILTGDRSPRFCGVGHQDVLDGTSQGWLIFFHAYRGSRQERCKTSTHRSMKVDRLRMSSAGWPFVNGSSKPRGR